MLPRLLLALPLLCAVALAAARLPRKHVFRVRTTQPRREYNASGGSPTKALAATASHSAVGTAIAWPGLNGGSAGDLSSHGGDVVTSTLTVYVIYYGNWPANSGQAVLENFVNSISSAAAGSLSTSVHKWWNIALPYDQPDGAAVTPKVVFGKSVTVGGQYSTSLNDGTGGTNDDIMDIVSTQLSSGALPVDPNAFYAVVTSGDVHVGNSVSGFCGSNGYCGWHSWFDYSSTTILYALIGDGTQQCNPGCGHNYGYSATANGFYAVDSLMSTFAHELVESATNPDVSTGWWALDSDGTTEWENADLCNGEFLDAQHPTVLTNAGDSYAYNMVGLNGYKYLVQTNVDIATQSCVLQLSVGTPILASPPPPVVVHNPSPTAAASPPPPILDPPPPPVVYSPPPVSQFPSPPILQSPPTLQESSPPPATQPPASPSPQLASPPPPSTNSVPSPHPVSQSPASPPPQVLAPSPSDGSMIDVPVPTPSSAMSPSSSCSDPVCDAFDGNPCTCCSDPDGCFCFDGSCLAWCVAFGPGAPCATCSTFACSCDANRTCQPWGADYPETFSHWHHHHNQQGSWGFDPHGQFP